jgi:FeS assembly protein IscX
MPLGWDDAEALGLALYNRFPHLDPLTVRFTDLRRWIAELPDFQDDPGASTEGKLEAVQMAWWEEWKENQE